MDAEYVGPCTLAVAARSDTEKLVISSAGNRPFPRAPPPCSLVFRPRLGARTSVKSQPTGSVHACVRSRASTP